MNDCAKQKHSTAQLSCIPNRVWKSSRWLVRCCSYSTAVPCDSSPRLCKASHMGFIVGGRGLTPADPWLGEKGLPLQCLSSFVNHHHLLWPAPSVQFLEENGVSPFDVFIEDGQSGGTGPSWVFIYYLHAYVEDCLQRGEGVQKIISVCRSRRSTL